MSEMGFYFLPTDKLTKKTKKRNWKIFLLAMLEVFTEILPITLILFFALISMVGSPMILIFPQKIFRNISSQPVISPEECKQI